MTPSSSSSICRLCGGNRPLRHSHILPELVYRRIYDESHTAVSYRPELRREGRLRKGLREPLLCSDCEARFQRWEDYFADAWFGSSGGVRPLLLPTGVVLIEGLDYHRFKLFHLSIIWRASVSRLPEFRDFTLGRRESRVRSMLLNEEPGTSDAFPLSGVALRDPETGTFMDRIVGMPRSSKLETQRTGLFIFAGVNWVYFTSGHATRRNTVGTLSEEGSLLLVVKNWRDHEPIKRLERHLREFLPLDRAS